MKRACELKKYRKIWAWTGYIDGKPFEKEYIVFTKMGVTLSVSFRVGSGKITNKHYI